MRGPRESLRRRRRWPGYGDWLFEGRRRGVRMSVPSNSRTWGGNPMRRKPYLAALCAALLAALAMCVVPAVSSAATRTDKGQNKRLARQAKSIKKVSNALTALAGALTDGSKGLDGRI